ncbi:kinesin light chain [Apiospora sp. TS-2023a]
MGTNSAATVASQMQQSFPSLRFGVLVGIGGGVPRLDNEIDIRLGDVVISQPAGQYGGVVQYDFGKTAPDGRIARTGSLNAPPTILLNALAKLRANDLRGKTQAHSHLSKLTSRPNFVSPGPNQDTLYDAWSTHMAGTTCAKCRPDDVLDRETRATTDPVLFFGTIASGNQVMKDGPTRDRYSQELGGILCFEMEAAGLMNSFPCLVVRGICDYADAHKNKRWQPYAAATAAAYAKELLSIVPPLAPGDLNGRNENFVGREDILSQLLERLPPSAKPDACQRAVIEGLGGIGKTQVAIEAAYRVHQAHAGCSIFWVPAVDMTMFENAYREIGRALEVKGIEDDRADVKALVKAALGRDEVGPWLLIIDNADDMALFTNGQLLSYLPFSRQGSILFTTRNHQAAVRLDTRDDIRLRELDEAEARELLHQRLQERQIGDLEHTTKLLDYLTYLPLAIRQASAYMASNADVTVLKYLNYCKSSDQQMTKMLSKAFDDQYRDRDRDGAIHNPVATTWLVSFQQVLRDAPVAAGYLQSIAYFAEKDIPVSLLSAGEDEMERDESISTLRAYAFILDRGTPDRFDVHRLYSEAEQMHRQTLALRETVLGREHPDTLSSMNNLANVLKNQGKYVEAEEMHRRTLALRETVLSREHPDTLASMNNLAESLRQQGKYVEAEEMHRETLALRETVLGREYPSTLGSMNNMALVLDRQGKYAEAEEMHRQTLAMMETVLGREHPSTLASMNNLAISLRQQGKYVEAEEMHRRTLALRETVLSREHPDTLASMNNLTESLRQQGKYVEAEEMHRRTLALTETALGREHPDTIGSMNNLAESLRQQGKYAEAEEMHRQTLALKETVLGREHPDTLASMNNLANVLGNQGKYEEAAQQQGQALEGYKNILGEEHPRTLGSMNNLALVLDRQGKYAEAEQMHRRTLALKETVLGREHPSTLASMNNLANVLDSQGKYVEAEEMHRRTLALTETALGREHPDTLDSVNALAIVLGNQEKYEEVAQQQGQAPVGHEDTLAEEHPRTLGSMDSLVEAFSNLRIHSEVSKLK